MNRIRIKWFLLDLWVNWISIFKSHLNHDLNRIILFKTFESWVESIPFFWKPHRIDLDKFESFTCLGVGTGRAWKTEKIPFSKPIVWSKPIPCREHNSHKLLDFHCGGKCRSLGRQSARLRGQAPAVNMLDELLHVNMLDPAPTGPPATTTSGYLTSSPLVRSLAPQWPRLPLRPWTASPCCRWWRWTSARPLAGYCQRWTDQHISSVQFIHISHTLSRPDRLKGSS